jgi:hypothetical protein
VGSEDAIEAVKTKLATLNSGATAGVATRLTTVLDEARDDIDAFRTGLEAWFDDTMARVSGWYKRRTQLIIAIIGVVVVLALNANTLAIGNALWKEPTLRAALVQQASAETGKTAGADAAARLKQAVADVNGVKTVGVPLGWTGDSVPGGSLTAIVTTVGGWLLTILAISLGAPFWFDTLSRFSRLRSSGKPEAPLPASGFGKPNERVTAAVPAAVEIDDVTVKLERAA